MRCNAGDDELQRSFAEEEIIERGQSCAETVGAGRLVRSFAVLSWQEACERNPSPARLGGAVGP